MAIRLKTFPHIDIFLSREKKTKKDSSFYVYTIIQISNLKNLIIANKTNNTFQTA